MTEFLLGDRDGAHLLLLFDEFVSRSIKFVLPLVDLAHVAARFERVFL